ncbi:MAG: sulfatase [Deltaproteobacteria bacterium]|nr:sulfatase [Deltaproteobacteria bacterium]
MRSSIGLLCAGCILNVAIMNRARRSAKPLARFSGIWLVASMFACSPVPETPAGPNFVLLSIDTLRADHLGCYGYERETSPNLDRLCARATRYTQAFAPAPWTLPSHVAMLTGRHPYDLGIRDLDSSIPADVPLLAEALAEAGYQTAAFVDSLDGGLVGSKRGFGRGFADYFHSPHGGPSDYKYDVARTLDVALDWLNGRSRESPFFLFIHTKSVHTAPYIDDDPRQGDSPYDQPGRDGFRFLPKGRLRYQWRDLQGNRGVLYLRELNKQIAEGKFDREDFPDSKIEELIGLYDGGIYYVDQQFQRLIDYLAAHQLTENTVVIVTADHGEAFLEHEYFLHSEVHRELLNVPLIVHDPKGPGGEVIELPVKLVDIVPSILRRAGVDPPSGLSGRPLPGADDASGAGRSQFSFYRFDRMSGRRAFSLQNEDLRVIHERAREGEEPRNRYYDLKRDPNEQRPIEQPDEAAKKLMGELLERIERGRGATGSRIGVDAKNYERLRALGYVE